MAIDYFNLDDDGNPTVVGGGGGNNGGIERSLHPDPQHYLSPDGQQIETGRVSVRGKFGAIMVPHARRGKEGGSQGFNHEALGIIHVDPHAPDGGVIFDAAMASRSPEEQLIYQRALQDSRFAHEVFYRLGRQPSDEDRYASAIASAPADNGLVHASVAKQGQYTAPRARLDGSMMEVRADGGAISDPHQPVTLARGREPPVPPVQERTVNPPPPLPLGLQIPAASAPTSLSSSPQGSGGVPTNGATPVAGPVPVIPPSAPPAAAPLVPPIVASPLQDPQLQAVLQQVGQNFNQIGQFLQHTNTNIESLRREIQESRQPAPMQPARIGPEPEQEFQDTYAQPRRSPHGGRGQLTPADTFDAKFTRPLEIKEEQLPASLQPRSATQRPRVDATRRPTDRGLKPTELVIFELPKSAGVVQQRYHEVENTEQAIFLRYDPAYDEGTQYMLPTGTGTMVVHLRSLGVRCRAEFLGIMSHSERYGLDTFVLLKDVNYPDEVLEESE